jgi:hypothetical protein
LDLSGFQVLSGYASVIAAALCGVFNLHVVLFDGGCHVMAVREGEFDLLLLVWRCRIQILIGVSLALVAGASTANGFDALC